MTTLSNLLETIDIKDIDVYPIFVVIILVIGMIVYIKKTKKENYKMNRALNIAFFIGFVVGTFGAIWFAIEVFLNLASPPVQVLVFICTVIITKQVAYVLWESILETREPWMNMFLTPSVDLALLVFYFFNQSTSFLTSMEHIGVLFKAIRIPNDKMVSILILMYLFVEWVLTGIAAILFYSNSGDREFVRSVCKSGSRNITHECINTIRQNGVTYSIFMQMFALIMYSFQHYWFIS